MGAIHITTAANAANTTANATAVEVAAPPAAAPTPTPEASAALQGWVPREQYTGDPSKWVDASTFIDRGKKFNHNLQREVAKLTAQIQSFEGTKEAFRKFHEETLAAKDVELQEAISALRIQRSQAIRDGDDEGAIQMEDRIDLLKEQRREVKAIPKQTTQAPAGAGPNMDDPVLLEWVEDGNKWFVDDPKLRDYAVALGEELIKSNNHGGKKGRAFLDLVAAKMADEFPRRFRQKEQAAAGGKQSQVEGGAANPGASLAGGRGKTEADLPAEDRELMKQFIKEGYVTKDAFLKSYFSRNA